MKNHEFKIKKFKDSTVYTLESASSGGTSAGSISSTNSPVGKLQRRNSIIVQDGQELDELKRPSGSMFLKFRVKTLPDDEKTIIAYGGFGTTPADVTVKTAKIKPFDANDTGEVIVRIKKLLADRDFIGVQKIYLDIPNGLKPRLEDLIDYTENDERLELYSAEDHDTDDETGGGQTAYYVNGKRVSIPGKPQAQVAGSSRGVASTGMVSINATDDGQRLIKALISQNKLSRDTKLVGNKITLRKDDYKKILNTLGNDRFQQYFTKKSEISEKGVGEDHSTMTQGYGRESASTGMAFSNRAKGAIPEEKTRLDPSCWSGKKIGNPETKVKGGVRVNNCVPKESYQLDEYETHTFTDREGNVWRVDDEGNRELVKGVGGSGTRTGGSRAGRSDDSPYNLKNKTTGKLLLQKGTQSPAVFNGLQHALNVAAKLQFGSWEPVRATMEEGVAEGSNNGGTPFNQETNLRSKTPKQLAALLEYWKKILKTANDREDWRTAERADEQIQLIKKILAGRIGKKDMGKDSGAFINEFAPDDNDRDGGGERFSFQEDIDSNDEKYLIEIYYEEDSGSYAVAFHEKRGNRQYVMYPVDNVDPDDLADGATEYVQDIITNVKRGSTEDFVAPKNMELEEFIPPQQGVAEGSEDSLPAGYGDYSNGATNPDRTASAQRQADREFDRREHERKEKERKNKGVKGPDDLETHQNPDPNEYDMEGDFVKNQIHTIVRAATELADEINDDDNLPEWVEEKISQAKGMLVSVMNYMMSEKEKQDDLSQSNFDENDQYFETLDQKLNNLISEKALSKSMQRFMGMVHAVQKGDMTAPSPAVAKAAKGMSMKAAHDYAATTHAGLPEKKRASKKK